VRNRWLPELPRYSRECVELFASVRLGQQKQENEIDWLTIDCGKVQRFLQTSQDAKRLIEARDSSMGDRHSGAHAGGSKLLAL
jgi:hypothetical protein